MTDRLAFVCELRNECTDHSADSAASYPCLYGSPSAGCNRSQKSRDLCAQQLAFLDSLTERNAPEQEDQEPENEAVTLPAPEENAVPVADAEPVPQEEAPQPESAAEPEPQPEFQEQKEEESPFPLDFKLNLEDLQFGRNYNGGDRR